MKTFGIILARGGSKGIKNKNLINFCGKPLIVWTIDQLKKCKYINEIFVSSDSLEILNLASTKNVSTIIRPVEISDDNSSSEDAWSHALDYIYKTKGYITDYIIAPQVTSPIRETSDFNKAIEKVKNEKLDSLLTVNELRDFFIWEEKDKEFVSENYDFNNRTVRQLINTKYHENGSFYIFKPEILRRYYNRLGGKIGYYIMEQYKSFQIDEIDDIKLCEVIMNGYRLNET